MSRSAPTLAPLFRSDQQLRILAELFGNGDEFAIGALAVRCGVAQATASREVARLLRHGLVCTRVLGRNTLVTANWRLPWARELRSILVQTVGFVGQLGTALSGLAGVDQVFVFGSWAARYLGEPGPAPRDIDILVIGDAALASVRKACSQVEQELRVEVNPFVVSRHLWTEEPTDPFLAEVKSRALVRVPLESL